MTDRNEDPNEWEHSEDAKLKEQDPIILVKVIIILGFLPTVIFGIVMLIFNWPF